MAESKTISASVRLQLKRWMVPNYAIVSDDVSVRVSDLDEDALKALAGAWLEDLYRSAGKENPFTHPSDP